MKLVGPFKQIITLRNLSLKGSLSDDQLEVIRHGGILVDGQQIFRVDDFDTLRAFANEVEEVEVEMVAMPGLVDCHTHMVWGGSRARDYSYRMRGESYEKILEEGGGIFDSVAKTRAAEKQELLDGLIHRVRRHERSGVTTIEVKSGYGLDVENELKTLEVVQEGREMVSADLISTCLAAHVCPKEFSDKKEYLDHILSDLLPVIKERNLASRVDAFIEPSAFPEDIAEDYLRRASNMGFDLTIHADQFNVGGSALAVKLGAASADHLEASGDKEVQILAKSDVIPVALPGASIGLGMQFTPARKLLNAGASLAISTDWNPGSAPMGDLLTQAAILGIYEKLSTAEVLAGITFRAASALRLNDRGVIAQGVKADFIAFPTDDYREILYQQGQLRPVHVWKNGTEITYP